MPQIVLEGQYVDFIIGRKSIRVGLEHDHSLYKRAGDETADEAFTTDSSNTSSEDESDGDSEDSMVAALAVKEGGLQSQEALGDEEEL